MMVSVEFRKTSPTIVASSAAASRRERLTQRRAPAAPMIRHDVPKSCIAKTDPWLSTRAHTATATVGTTWLSPSVASVRTLPSLDSRASFWVEWTGGELTAAPQHAASQLPCVGCAGHDRARRIRRSAHSVASEPITDRYSTGTIS